MKKASIILLLAIGFCLGWAVDGRTEAKAEKSRAPLTAADTAEIVKLYPTQHALSALHSMRVLALLNSNDVVRAKEILQLDVKSHISSLENLGRLLELSDSDQKALHDGKTFLGQHKK